MKFTILSKSDVLLLRKPMFAFISSCIVVTVFYFVLEESLRRIANALNVAQAQFEQIDTSVQQIAQEQQTVTRYIGRYSQIQADGGVSNEDRLNLLEDMSDIRTRYYLFPIDIDLSEQTVTRLEGDAYALNPVGPVDLQSTRVSFRLPLLHEQDLINFTTNLLLDNGLIIPQHCAIEVANILTTEFFSLSEKMYADCTFLWYTFNIDAQEVVPDEY